MHGSTQPYEPMPTGNAHERATNWAIMVGGATAAAIGFYVGANDGSATTALLSATVGGIVSGAFLKTQMTPPPRGNHPLARLRAPYESPEQLTAAKLRFTISRTTVVRGLKDKQDLRRRLVNLRAKMVEVALAAYRPRILSIDAGLVTLDKQIAMGSRLRDGYDKSITMIDIELESGVAADQMSEDLSATILEAVRELHALEASQAELARQLEANVEVELLLRP